MIFPHPLLADEDGILAIGGDLEPATLLAAYRFGLFPWYMEGEPIMWWFPRPRFVVPLDDFKVPKSMRTYFNQGKYYATVNTRFDQVIDHCKTIERRGQEGTWITTDMRQAYCALHRLGRAHSVEVWKDQEMVGGLYGVSYGRFFSGESMFSLQRDASKFGAIFLFRLLHKLGYTMVDCQQDTPHLRMLGGRDMDELAYFDLIRKNLLECDIPILPVQRNA